VEVKITSTPNTTSPRIYTGNEVSRNPGVYNHQFYKDQFLVSQENSGRVLYVFAFVKKPSVNIWHAEDDNTPQWIRTNQTLTITFKGDN